MNQNQNKFWNVETDTLLTQLNTSRNGLSTEEAEDRTGIYGRNLLKPQKRFSTVVLFLSQFKSPIILILLAAAILSFFLKDVSDGTIILSIIIISGGLGFWQEFRAANAVKKLLETISVNVNVLRDGSDIEIPLEEVVPGDIIIFNAGDIVPADCRILQSRDLFVNESTLTGETYPVEKNPDSGILPAELPISKRINSLFMGTNVVSGTGHAVAVKTGKNTEFGKVSEKLKLRPAETEFEHSIKRFGYFLMEVTTILVIAIFAFNMFLKRPFLDSFLFAMALAVGLTPQLLPAIISVNLSRGSKKLADLKVIVKRLSSIENFGSMNIICSDKTGTLTEGVMQLDSAMGIDGKKSNKTSFYAYINSYYETGFVNPIDEAIRNSLKFDLTGYEKIDEIPYDFIRKRLSILVTVQRDKSVLKDKDDKSNKKSQTGKEDKNLLITKGSFKNILDVCSYAETPEVEIVEIDRIKDNLQKTFESYSNDGLRVISLAYKETDSGGTRESESGMIFLGFITFMDNLKQGISETVKDLKSLGITLKIITGDNKIVAACIAEKAGLTEPKILIGQDLLKISDEALVKQVSSIDLFAEIEPNEKERIIIALKKAGNVVGYMGDGVNDASALYAADVSISVNSAADVAKEAADIVLLEKDLEVLVDGVREGRAIFANTLKYVYMATSANFGNMFSMAGASLFLPFLPLLPKQILMTNLLTDFPEMTIATDNVDREMVTAPRKFNMKFIRNFMLIFGLISSIFDYATFGVLLLIMHSTQVQFRTGWFLESVISAAVIVLAVRTRRPFFKSKPGKYLLIATLVIVAVTVAIPYTPLGAVFGFQPLPVYFLLVILLILVLYIGTVELVKRTFYKKLADS